uniref:Ankyrin repeat and SOCS box containing 18 n=1 Tax=Chelydra serpentina TaxID=8475 RepID=A0A8C3XMY8_CHESE
VMIKAGLLLVKLSSSLGGREAWLPLWRSETEPVAELRSQESLSCALTTSPSFSRLSLSLSLCPTGLWSLEYKRELTTPLCITARNGHTACVRHLLFWRADPNMAPGGQSALHEACEGGHMDCTELLLEHRANPNLLSEEGLAPLHLCTNQNTLGCAKLLVKYGAMVDLPSEETQETPLHIAAKHGLYDHALLYLRYGASVDRKNSREETALSVTCGQAKEQAEQGTLQNGL